MPSSDVEAPYMSDPDCTSDSALALHRCNYVYTGDERVGLDTTYYVLAIQCDAWPMWLVILVATTLTTRRPSAPAAISNREVTAAATLTHILCERWSPLRLLHRPWVRGDKDWVRPVEASETECPRAGSRRDNAVDIALQQRGGRCRADEAGLGHS